MLFPETTDDDVYSEERLFCCIYHPLLKQRYATVHITYITFAILESLLSFFKIKSCNSNLQLCCAFKTGFILCFSFMIN